MKAGIRLWPLTSDSGQPSPCPGTEQESKQDPISGYNVHSPVASSLDYRFHTTSVTSNDSNERKMTKKHAARLFVKSLRKFSILQTARRLCFLKNSDLNIDF